MVVNIAEIANAATFDPILTLPLQILVLPCDEYELDGIHRVHGSVSLHVYSEQPCAIYGNHKLMQTMLL